MKEKILKILSEMSTPRNPWDGFTTKTINDFYFEVENADGYRIERAKYKDNKIVYICDGSGDYEIDNFTISRISEIAL